MRAVLRVERACKRACDSVTFATCRLCVHKITAAQNATIRTNKNFCSTSTQVGGSLQEISTAKVEVFVVDNGTIVFCGFVMVFVVDDLLVLPSVGATESTTLSFILPGLFFWEVVDE